MYHFEGGESDERHIVVDCEICHRTIWAGSICRHGKCPPPKSEPKDEAPREPYRPKRPLRGGLP